MILHPFLPAPRGQSRQTSHSTEAKAVQTKFPAKVNLILHDLKEMSRPSLQGGFLFGLVSAIVAKGIKISTDHFFPQKN